MANMHPSLLWSAEEREREGIPEWLPYVAGGGLIAYGLTSRSRAGLALAVLGGSVLWAGSRKSGAMSPLVAIGQQEKGIRAQKTVTIAKSPEELYQFWRKLSNHPLIMDHILSVTEYDHTYSHWIAKAPAGKPLEWDAQIVTDVPNEQITWRSLEGSDVPNAGSVSFRPAGRGTEVTVSIHYDPPGGLVAKALATLFGQNPEMRLAMGLRQFKQLMETGEIATTEDQPKGVIERKPKNWVEAGVS